MSSAEFSPVRLGFVPQPNLITYINFVRRRLVYISLRFFQIFNKYIFLSCTGKSIFSANVIVYFLLSHN
ncbi:hypothetical protein KsCSTR_15770 [Candidatus Kuenenia stuttgartiensis]|uniref:Uncharacterized protein n=1 Tax=Kuenenia stuttgartiensis TaxID=174633 RepID=Q1Q1P6_KUEST|nr:hypothetical protein KsCSTR_15770 [Candidatus Kuenenia stuttgartiensis]CAJ73935.1 unknown protein [Candidatus Kuenenia stuttgartiensis]